MKSEARNIIVLGAGFKGMMAALKLSQLGYKVTLMDKAKKPGGILNSPSWDDMYIDLGCHLFFNQEDKLTQEIVSILKSKVHPVSSIYASYFNQEITKGLAIPNFESLENPIKKEMYEELMSCFESKENTSSLKAFYSSRFGKKTTLFIEKCLEKSHDIKMEELDFLAKDLLPYSRVRLFSVEQALKLKQKDWFDDRIAVPREQNLNDTKRNSKFDFFEFYPLENGLSSFCENLYHLLVDKGVNICLGETIEAVEFKNEFNVKLSDESYSAPLLYWALPQHFLPKLFNLDISLQPYIHSVPLVLFYFTVPQSAVSNLTYMHNFDSNDSCFRISVQSNYADNGISKNLALICCEVPVKLTSPIWLDPDKHVDEIWSEVIKMQIVENVDYFKVKHLQTPSAFSLPKKGYSDAFMSVKKQIDYPNLIGINSWEYSKNDTLSSIYETLKILK